MNDLRSAFRQLTKNRGFSVVAILTLALGLTVNITVFGIINTIFFQPLPVKDASQLVYVMQQTPKQPFPHGQSWHDYQDIRREIGEFSDVLALFYSAAQLSVPGRQPDRTWIEAVSGNYFSMLGIEPALGRLFLPGEGEKIGADPIVVLSHSYWQSKLGGDPSIVGRPINVNGRPFTVVGVAPATFNSAQWAMAPGAFVPATMLPQFMENGAGLLEYRGANVFKTLARLKPGTTVGQTQAPLAVLAGRLAADYPQEHAGMSLNALPEMRCRPEPSVSGTMPFAAAVFMGLAILVLAIACANVANLMFSRAIARRREMGIRAAVGASRWQLIRLLLTESLLLALIAGVLGIVLSHWAGDLIQQLTPTNDMPVHAASPNEWASLAFTLVAALGAALITGIFPALRATRINLQSALHSGAGSAPAFERHWLRSALVIGQVACCLVVLICGGLFVQSLRQMSNLPLGFRPERLLMASIDLGMQGYTEERARQFHRDLVERAAALPGVESAALAAAVPLDVSSFMLGCEVGAEGKIIPGLETGDEGYVTGNFNRIDENYARTVGLSLVRGRELTRQDDSSAPRVALINESMARMLWPNEDALGKRFRFSGGAPYTEVVGIVADGKYRMLNEKPQPFVYLPLAQNHGAPVTLHLRTRGDPAAAINDLRKTIQSLDADLPIYNVRTMEEHLRTSAFALMPLRTGASLLSAQAVLGLALAIMGIYGVVAYTVSQRTREIGIRMALGADRGSVLRMVIRSGLRMTIIGMLVGLAIAFLLAHALATLLYGLNPMSVPVFGFSILLLGGLSLLASWIPARRATLVDPIDALRAD